MFKHFKIILIIAAVNFSCTTAISKLERKVVKETVPLDGSIRHGRLSNGLVYYIKNLPDPQPKVYLQFYVKAGSNQQDADQAGMAHAVEHMAFRATNNFPSGLHDKALLGKLNMEIFDINGTAGFKYTKYNFDAPPSNPEALAAGLLWFKDIATGLKLTEEDINAVRGELRQEFILRVGENPHDYNIRQDLSAGMVPCIPHKNNFIQHLRTFDPEDLRRFYRDWYRPELMVVSIVGNFEDLDKLESKIREQFSDIAPQKSARISSNCEALFFNRPPQFVVVERKPNPVDSVQNHEVVFRLNFRDPETIENLGTMKGISQVMIWSLLTDIINRRYKEAVDVYNSYYQMSVEHTYDSSTMFLYAPSALALTITSENANEKPALQKALEIVKQIKHGVMASEFENAKEKYLQYMNNDLEKEPGYWIREIEKHFIYGEALPSNKLNYLKEELSSLTLKKFTNLVSQLLSKKPEDIGIIAPTGHKVLSYTEKEIRSWIKETYSSMLKPYKLAQVPANLMNPAEVANLKKVKVVDKGVGESGAKEYILDNGVKLVLKIFKPTPGMGQDQIKIHGFSLKGANCFPKENFFSALNAPNIIENAGVNGMDKFEINRFLSKRGMSPGVVSLYIDCNETGVQGIATAGNLESVLQLIYLYITKPNKNKEAFKDWKFREYKAYKDDPSNLDFKNIIREMTGDNSVVGTVLGTKSLRGGTKFFKGLKRTNLNIAYDIYKNLFGKAEDFTFIVSGDFDMESILPLVVKYLGNLPNLASTKGCIQPKEESHELKAGPKYQEFLVPGDYKMKNIKYGLRFIKIPENPNDWQEQLKVEALAGISRQKLWSLRFEKNYSIYAVGMWGIFDKKLGRYEIGTDLSLVPEEFPEIRKEVHQIIKEIKSGLITQELFQQGMSRMYHIYNSEKRAGTHRKLHQNLYEHYRYGQPWVDPEKVESFVKSLTVKDIVEIAKKYYIPENLYEFVMWDEKMDLDIDGL